MYILLTCLLSNLDRTDVIEMGLNWSHRVSWPSISR